MRMWRSLEIVVMNRNSGKRGRKPGLSGSYVINRAEDLFDQSCAEGKPDFHYVALAIGANPASPPDWAMLACIEAHDAKVRNAAAGIDNDIPIVLDGIVRYYLEKQREFEIENDYEYEALEGYVVPPLNQAITTVLKQMGLRQSRASKGETDWFKDIRRAWEWEQKNDPAPFSKHLFTLDGKMKRRGGRLVPIAATSRIDNVISETLAEENGDPPQTRKWAWLVKRQIEEKNTAESEALVKFGPRVTRRL